VKVIFRNAGLIYWMIKRLEEKYPDKQVGKTKIQKLMYLLGEKLNEDLGYSIYHYGPYSSEIAESLGMANMMGWLDMVWHVDKGYFISTKDIPSSPQIQDEKKEAIKEVVDKYGKFNAVELSIIATADYVKKNFGIEDPNEIIDVVLALKPNNKKEWVKDILEGAGVINEPD